jgi:hypothetical protein
LGSIGLALLVWLWCASVRYESDLILLGSRSYAIGHNDSVVFLGWWDYGRPFTGAREVLLTLHGTDASDGPLFPGFRIAGKLGLFDRVFMVPYWSLVLGWIVIWLVTALYLRWMRKRMPVAVGPAR